MTFSLKNPWGQKSKSHEEKSVGKTFLYSIDKTVITYESYTLL
jgi:hypothetical protein